MKTLIIVSTKVSGGKGGISSALAGYQSGLDEQQIDYLFVESHVDGKNKLLQWAKAFLNIIKLSLKYRKNAVFWFHGAQKTSLLRKATLALFPRIIGAKNILHVHSPAFADYLKRNGVFLKLVLSPYTKLVALTPWWKKTFEKHKIKHEVIISGNPNSTEFGQIAKKNVSKPILDKQGEEPIQIFSMARMVSGKGIETVIEAMVILSPQYRLTIAGDGPMLETYIELAEHLGVSSRINFLGWIDGNEKIKYLESADIFCLPSKYESFGMVFIEAMAFNLPIVALGWGPIPDVVTENVGKCCQEQTSQEVRMCIEHVSNQLSSYSGQGPQRVLECYTPDVVVKNIIREL